MSAKKQCSLSGQGSISISRKRSDIEGPNVIYDHKRRKINFKEITEYREGVLTLAEKFHDQGFGPLSISWIHIVGE